MLVNVKAILKYVFLLENKVILNCLPNQEEIAYVFDSYFSEVFDRLFGF